MPTINKSLFFIPLAIALLFFPGLPIPAHAALSWETTVQGPFTWEQALSHCETLETGGHTDWRLPDINELQTIVRYDFYDPATGVSGVQSVFYWSSTTHHSSNGSAWGIDFTDGDVTTKTKTDSFYVLAVRGGAYSPKCVLDPGNGNGTVTDPESGLTWEQATSGPMTWEEALAHAEDLNVGGHSDWRLPDINELQSLVRYDEYNPAIEGSDCFKYGPFPDMIAGFFWSSSTHHSSNGSAWGVDFKDGDVTTQTKTKDFYVRAVRGGSHEPRCTSDPGNGNGTATDAESGLMWGQDTIGPMTWQAALEHCETLTLGNHSDWRLPDINELQSLVRYDSYNPAIRGSDCYKYGPFPDMVSGFFWSSTTHHSSNGNAWGVDFTNGDITTQTKTELFYVRPVRGGQADPLNPLTVTVEPALSGEAPLTVELTAQLGNAAPDYFTWDVMADGVVDASTADAVTRFTLDEPGTYPIKSVVYDLNGNRYEKIVQVEVLPAISITENIRFEPFYPADEAIPSPIMQGGQAARWYRVYRVSDGTPVRNREIYYRLFKDGAEIGDFRGTADVDGRGFVMLHTPLMTSGGHCDLVVTDNNFDLPPFEALDEPSFDVAVSPREFSESYKFLIGLGATVGLGGPSAKLGPMEFKTAKLGLHGEANMSTEFVLENAGDRVDLEVVNVMDTKAGLETFAGISGSLVKNQSENSGLPKLEAGAKFNGYVSNAVTIRHRFENYTDDSRPDRDVQLIAIASLMFENLIRQNPAVANNVLYRMLLEFLINKISVTDNYYQGMGSTFGLEGQHSIGADLSVGSPIGGAGASLRGSLKAFDGEMVYEQTRETDVDGPDRVTQAMTSSLDVGSFKFGLGKKFGPNAGGKDAPELKLDLFQFSALNVSGERSLSFSVGPVHNAMTFKTLMDREGDQVFTFLVPVDITERYLEMTATDRLAITSIAGKSDLAYQMFFNDNFEISTEAYSNAYDAFLGVNQGSVAWRVSEKDITLSELPIELGLSLGLSVDLSFLVKVEVGKTYDTGQGVILPGRGFLPTALYEKDAFINGDNFEGAEIIVAPYVKIIDDAISEALETVEEIKEAAQELIVETKEAIIDGGAVIKAGAEAMVDGVIVRISRITGIQGRSFKIRAGMRSTGDAYEAATVGDVFIVSAETPDGALMEAFSEPLELTIGYTEADLTAAGYALTDAAKLNIYRWHPDDLYYEFIGGTLDAAIFQMSADIDRPGQYVLAIDSAAPRIVDFNVSDGTTTPLVIFTVREDLSGLDVSAFSVALDGAAVVDAANYENHLDVQNGSFQWQPETPLTEGEHQLAVAAKDTTGNSETYTFDFTVDATPPVLDHAPVTTADAGTPLTIQASVTDNNDMAGATLFYRPKINELPYRSVEMTAADANQYAAAIPAQDLIGAGVRYYIKAVDAAGNETATDLIDIIVTDTTGPTLEGDIAVKLTADGLKLTWTPAPDADTAGYRIYAGPTPDSLELQEEIGPFSYVTLPDTLTGAYIAVASFDAFGNEGQRITSVQIAPCFPGDVDCSNEIDLADAITAFKILTGIALNDPPAQIADIDGDGVIGLAEAINALRYAAGLK